MTDNRTALVMLPGLDGTGRVFEPLLRHLAHGIAAQVVRYPVDRPMSFQEHVALVRKQLPEESPFVLLAESFSGPICLRLLADPPANLAGVIFVATFASYPSPLLLDAASCLPQGLLLKLCSTKLFSRLFCLGGARGEAVELFTAALRSVKLTVLAKRLQLLAELPPPAEPVFCGPCLYIQATNDRLVAPRAAEAMQRHLPQLQLEQLRGPHIILLAEPQSGARLINHFIDSLTESP